MSLTSFPLFGADAAWWKMDTPTQRVIITALLRFEERMEDAALLETLARGIAPFPQFRSRIKSGILPRWEAMPHFDLAAHVERYASPALVTVEGLEKVVGDLMTRPLPPDLPLWKLYVIDEANGGSALIFRVHHAIGDGAALVHFLLSLTEGDSNTPTHTRRKASLAWYEPLRFALSTLITPFMLLFMPPERNHPLHGPLQGHKQVAWSNSIPLSTIKAIGKATDSTVNDVLIAAVAGALHPILAPAGVQRARAAIPVALRTFGANPTLQNHIGLVFVELPVGDSEPAARLENVKRQMQALKRSPQAIITFAILWLAGYLPTIFARALAWFLGTKITAVMTNVPGPQVPLTLAGNKISQMMFWVPEAGNCGLGISLLSYNESVTVGIVTDSAFDIDSNMLTSNFEGEIRKFANFKK